MAAVEEKDESKAEFMSVKAGPQVHVNAIKQRDKISRIGNLDWDKELKHWVRRKPRGMAQMRVDVKVLVEDQKFWHPNKRLDNFWLGADCKPGSINQMKGVPDTGAMVSCTGPAMLHKLNMAQGQLIPTSQSLMAANNKTLHIMGAVMVEIRAEKEGKVKFTRQCC